MIEINLGPEYDDELRLRLFNAVRCLGGAVSLADRGCAGSQEVTTFQLSLPGGTIEACAETYMGLVLRGDVELMEPLVREIQGPRG